MKRITIVVLVFTMLLFLFGCKEDEYFELEGEESNVADEQLLETAENFDNSRPFVVYVCGEVKKPGVYELSEGSRVMDAVEAAGGYTKNASDSYINLAGLVSDEQKIYVPSSEEVSTQENGNISINADMYGENLNEEKTKKVDINHASKEELMSIPGIGEAKANKIIAYRESNGAFGKTEDIMQISGIKEGMYNKIKDSICVK